MVPSSAFDVLVSLRDWLARDLRLEDVLGRPWAERRPIEFGDLAWLCVFDDDDQLEFHRELHEALTLTLASGSTEPGGPLRARISSPPKRSPTGPPTGRPSPNSERSGPPPSPPRPVPSASTPPPARSRKRRRHPATRATPAAPPRASPPPLSTNAYRITKKRGAQQAGTTLPSLTRWGSGCRLPVEVAASRTGDRDIERISAAAGRRRRRLTSSRTGRPAHGNSP